MEQEQEHIAVQYIKTIRNNFPPPPPPTPTTTPSKCS